MTLSKQRELDRKKRLAKALDEIAKEHAKQRKEDNKKSYCTHTPPEALKILSERSRSHLNEEELNRKYIRRRKR